MYEDVVWERVTSDIISVHYTIQPYSHSPSAQLTVQHNIKHILASHQYQRNDLSENLKMKNEMAITKYENIIFERLFIYNNMNEYIK